jgi:hypothetical protein
MKNKFWFVFFLAIVFSAGTIWARELTPLEKAMRVLAQKEKAASASANANTGTASATRGLNAAPSPNVQSGSLQTAATGNTWTSFSLPGALGGTLTAVMGNSFTAVAMDGSTLTAIGSTLTAQRLMSPAEALALTLTASAEEVVASWGNTAVGWKNFGGYLLLRGDADHEPSQQNTLPVAVNTYRDTSVTPKAMYLYQVVVVDTNGNSLISSDIEKTRLAPSVPPDTPANVQASAEEERARIVWNPVQRSSHAIAGYAVYRSNSIGAEGAWINKKIITKSEFYDDNGEYGRQYSYQVAAVDSWGVTGEASTTITAYARRRSRSGLVLMSTAYRGFGRTDPGLNGDLQFTYFIGTLYGEQDKSLSPLALYLDPISLWLLTADAKYTPFTEENAPLALAVGGKGSLSLFAGQQSSTGGSFTFSQKSSFNTLWGGYLALSRSFGPWGLHTGYLYGTEGNAVYYLSKYLEPTATQNLVYAGIDFPIVRRMNVAVEVLYPMDAQGKSALHPLVINTHVDRLFNFDISYLRWDQGWALLGYFNLRFTLYPGTDK